MAGLGLNFDIQGPKSGGDNFSQANFGDIAGGSIGTSASAPGSGTGYPTWLPWLAGGALLVFLLWRRNG